MRRPRLLDLYCCQGGASAGYAAAGFEVTGVDIEPQPRYPFTFVQGDAIGYLREHGHEFDAVAASPPCQAMTVCQRIQGREHPRLIGPTRDALTDSGLPWVIENVEGALPELRNPLTLCGSMFGLRTYRHRLFEIRGFRLDLPHHPVHTFPLAKMGRPVGEDQFGHYVGNFSGVERARADLGVPWMNRDGIRESIPPAYAAWIGSALVASLAEDGAVAA
jgi:DNA (cytosine-5)-methyltransferase 1